MESVTQSRSKLASNTKDAQKASGLLSSESVLNTLRLILAGAPLAEVLTIIARTWSESSGDADMCTIWLPEQDGMQLYCAAAPSLPGFFCSRRIDDDRTKGWILWYGCLSEGTGLC